MLQFLKFRLYIQTLQILKLTKTFRFVDPKDAKMTGVSGTIYTLSVNADRTQLLASTPTIANTVIATITDAVDK